MSTHNICFHGEIKKNSTFKLTYLRLLHQFSSLFIDHKSKINQIDSLEFHFYITPIKIKKSEKNIFLKIEFSD